MLPSMQAAHEKQIGIITHQQLSTDDASRSDPHPPLLSLFYISVSSLLFSSSFFASSERYLPPHLLKSSK